MLARLVGTALVAGSLVLTLPQGTAEAQSATKSRKAPAPVGRLAEGPLLGRKDVAADLGLTAEQRANPKTEETLAALTPAQRARLRQIARRLQGPTVLLDPEVQAEFGIDSALGQRLAEVGERNMRRMLALRESIPPDSFPARARATGRANGDSLLAVLSSDQQAQYRESLGKPFVETESGVGIVMTMSASSGAAAPDRESEPLPKLELGSKAPDFVATGADGKKVKLSQLRGKIVVLDLWATWCGPCIGNLPALLEVQHRTKDQGVVVLALNVWDDEAAYQAFLKNNSRFTVRFARDAAGDDRDKAIPRDYRAESIPATFVIDRSGKIVFQRFGDANASSGGGTGPVPDRGPVEPDPDIVAVLRKLGVKI